MREVCPLAPAVGERLEGKYEILRELRRGTTGVVYEATDIAQNRRVALKTLFEATSGDGQFAARFRREARAAGKLEHPHILKVLDLGRTPRGLLYLVTELLDGAPLAAWLKQSLRLPVSLAVDVIGQVLDGLSAAHQHGVVHRDLSPECIYVLNRKDRPNFVKVVDFGVTHMVAAPGARPPATKAFGSAGGQLLGTPLYMSPEQIRGPADAVDQRSDIYAAGVILYQMLCGSTPFLGDDLAGLLRAILEADYPRPRVLRPEIPAGLESVVVCALERDLRKRFPTAAAMRESLTRGSSKSAPGSASGLELPDGFILEPDTVVDAQAVRPGLPPAPGALPPPPPLKPGALVPVAREPEQPMAERMLWAEPPAADAAPLKLDMSPRARAQARDRGVSMAAIGRPRRSFPWLALVGGVLVLAITGMIAMRVRRHEASPNVATPAPSAEEVQKFVLIVYPETANVTIDHLPVSARELPLDSGTPRAHLMKVAAPGRQTRMFSFTSTVGMKLIVRLGRTLPVPSPADPPPLPAELVADAPDEPRPAVEIDRAFAVLDRYGVCLALTATVNAEARRAGARDFVRGEDFEPCRRLAAETTTDAPKFPALPAAARAFVTAALDGQKPETLAHMAGRFRAEYLAERTAWQMQELARAGQDDGQTLAWHMRRVALAAQAWVRARKSGLPNGRGGEIRAAQLEAYVQALVEVVRSKGLGNIRGADDFVRSAQELVALARPKSGARVGDAAVYEGCRKLLTDFDALVLD